MCIKGVAVVMKAGCLSLGQALAQWVHTGEFPDKMTWILIWAFVGASVWDSLSNFMSGTYERWKGTGSLKENGAANGTATSSNINNENGNGVTVAPAPPKP